MGEPVDTLKQASEVLRSQCAQLQAELHNTLNSAAQDLTVRVTNPSYAEYLNSPAGKIITEQREQIVSLQSSLTAAQQRIADLEAQCARVQKAVRADAAFCEANGGCCFERSLAALGSAKEGE